MDELRTKHRKELKDLQARITQKKKNATKKTRKGVNDECDTLERDLAERQQAEIAAVDADVVEDGLAELTVADDKPAVEDEVRPRTESSPKVRFDPAIADGESEPEPVHSQTRSKKPNRQKARLARKAAEQEAQIAAADKEAESLPDLREQEMKAMKTQMEKLHLKETFVRPDGHCLYSACAMGIPAQTVKSSGSFSEGYKNIRSAAADFIAKHPDDFSAFLEEPLDKYVDKIRNTAEWGGQLELQAIARSYKINIHVLQADGRVEQIGPEAADSINGDVWLAYYRHSFGLGEHYNALHKSG